ncbi:Sensor histidine kinase RcsC [Emticicia aquatica]|uniref:histidine kinase n=1 Tax=Emticicia aquatica TaxID=1681835 RepID=A0ABM9AV65_9BACT|nr:CheR family methyltransferase [Emticicia aquatica]CAH0997939.1 Sensor histidine kinase RcsC [Emticicia aquatica]
MKTTSKKTLSTQKKLIIKNAKSEPEPSIEIIKEETPILDNEINNPFTVVAIGASAGGLDAITQLLQNLSPNTGMAYIFVQHLSPDHKSMLTPLLSKVTAMKVQDIDNMEKMQPDNVYVIPYNKGVEVIDGHIKLTPRTKGGSPISIDILFSSLAETHKENVIGIVLSGSASDGTRGLKEIKQAGGITFAQDDSAKFTSMPHSAIAEGVVDFVLSPKEIGIELTWMSKHPLIKRHSIKPTPEDAIDNNNPDLKIILDLLHKRKNVDFSHYKMNTIKRRMLRRMLIHKIKSIDQYADLLLQINNEVDILYQDLLINVTEFFRDTEAFLLLKKIILPRLLKSKTPDDTLRIWVAACATGEEVYSIAMILLEIQQNRAINIPFQIFASDLSAEAISIARNGEYSINQLKNVSAKRLQHFFVKSKDKYRITKSLRDVCVFAQHNILNDPPFSRMDFISCRNFLIYLDTSAQKKAISTFHYALNEEGYLMLGKSETIGTSAQLFNVLNKKFKFYSRKKNSGLYRNPDIKTHISKIILPDSSILANIIPKKTPISANGNLGNAFDSVLLSQYVPASVIINYDLEILQFKGLTASYLQNSSGKASFNILKMAHLEITFELRNAIHHAIKTKQIVRKTGIEMNRDVEKNTVQIVNIEVAPLKVEGEEPLLIVVFTGQQMELPEYPLSGSKNNSIAKDRRIKKLEEELAAARADMGSITHDQEAANEELQSANEEIISSNEELQSLNEELETSKEEIESTNEELTTSNQELHARIQQIEELYTYYEGIISTVHEPVLILDKNIRIKSANKSFCKMFNTNEDDITGISLYKLGNNLWNIPPLRELLEDIVPKNIRFHDFEVEQTFPVIGQKTMLLNAHRIVQESQNEELIVLTIADITEVKRLAIELEVKQKKVLEIQLEAEKKALKVIEDSNKRYNMLLMQSPFAFAIMQGKDMVVTLANDSLKEMWGKGQEIEGKPLLQILPEIKNTPFPHIIDNVYSTGVPFQGYESQTSLLRNGKIEDVYFNFVYQPYHESDATISGVVIIADEVTPQVATKRELIEAKNNADLKTQIAEDAVKAKQQFLSNMSHEIRTPMNAIIGFTNIVLKTELDVTQKEYINAIKVSGDALVILINDILDLAKVDAGKMTFEQSPFNLSVSIDTMIQLFEAKINEKNLEFNKEYDERIPQILLGDQMRLRQIILNLVSNAVKFTTEGKITMSIRMLSKNTKKVSIEFKLTDTGIGIRKNKLEHIFNNFEQAHKETSSSYGGTGLGLAIVKQLVELQGGIIIVSSELGKGSTFGFVLDFETTQPNTQIEEKSNLTNTISAKDELQNIKVLVAEDMALNQLLIKIILADLDFVVDIAENGKIAVDMLVANSLANQVPYDIILMDLQMPEMNGFEATTYIRQELKSNIPIIALTADVTTVDVDKCLAVGMNDYISKPIDEKLLYSKMIKCLKK